MLSLEKCSWKSRKSSQHNGRSFPGLASIWRVYRKSLEFTQICRLKTIANTSLVIPNGVGSRFALYLNRLGSGIEFLVCVCLKTPSKTPKFIPIYLKKHNTWNWFCVLKTFWCFCDAMLSVLSIHHRDPFSIFGLDIAPIVQSSNQFMIVAMKAHICLPKGRSRRGSHTMLCD